MGHLKLKDGTTFPLTLSVGDIRDISKRSGAFSKTITLVGDDDNNELLNHYYDVNIVAGTFDINKLQACQIIQNGIVILDNAYMQLVEVVKSQTNDAHNQQIEYKVLVKDSVSDFFTKLGNKTLNDINIQEIVLGASTLTCSSANVVSSFSNTITDGYKYLLPYDVDNLYSLKGMNPAIYAKLYFDSIFNVAGFTYEWGNQSPFVHTTNNNYFEKLVIPYNGGVPTVDRSGYLVEATKASLTTSQSGLSWTEQIVGFTEVTDAESIFDPVNGDYAVPFWIQNPENIQVQVTINFDVDLFNNGGVVANRVGAGTSFIKCATKEQAQTIYFGANIYEFSLPSTVAVGSVPVVSGQTAIVTLNATNLDNTDILELFLQSVITLGVSYDQTVDIDVTINSSTWKILPSSDTIGYQSDVDLNVYVPKQIKQSDFIKSIFMLYNLYAEVDSSQPNKLILKHRDDYYDAGTEIDWTDKLAKDKDQTIQFLPELSAKKMILSYKDDSDDANKVYKSATNETYGQLEYTFENEYVKGIDRKELIFSPTPIATTSFNAIVPLIGYYPESNIRILIDGGTQTCDSFTIYDVVGGAVQTSSTTAPLLSHFDDPIIPTFDLNFATCDYYFYSELATKTNNNIYNLYWRRTLGQIDKGKMLSAYFDLNEVDIQSLKLNDKIRIDNSWWHINKVIDYDANERKLTKVELISVDEEVEFTPFATTPTVPVNPNEPNNPPPIKPTRPEIVRPVKDIVSKNSYAKNLILGDVDVKGVNNVIHADVKKAIVVGDNQTIEEDGIHTEKLFINGDEVTGNLATSDLTQTDTRRTYRIGGNTASDYLDLLNSDGNGVLRVAGNKVQVDNDDQAFELVTGGQTARATTATDGFLYIPTCNGTPTGVPTGQAGNVALIYDNTNQVLYIYSGGAWNAH